MEQFKKNIIETEQVIYDFKNNKLIELNTADYAKAQNTLYKELGNLQSQEYKIKEEMVGADQGITRELQKQLEITTKQADQIRNILTTNKLQDSEKETVLLNQKSILQSKLNIQIDEESKKEKLKTQEIQKQIDLYKQQMNINIQNLQTTYGKLVDSKAIDEFKSKLDGLTTSNFNKGALSNEFKQIEANVKASSTALKVGQKDIMSFSGALNQALNKFSIWMIAATIEIQFTRFFSKGISFVTDLNKSLTEIAIVTNRTQQETAELGEEYQKTAVAMGSLTEEIAKASVEFYRQGLSQSQVMERMKTTTEYAKISSLDFNEAAQIMTATVNSMGVSIEHAADVYAFLGDATATGADEIGRAMQKVGGTAGALGVEFEKVSSWIAEISSRTRESSETIGYSVSALMARFQSIKETGFNEEDSTNINDVTKALKVAGIQAADTSGQLENFGLIMDSLGSKWSTLDKKTQAYIATTLAGSRQQSRFLNLMEGYSDSVSLYEKSLQAAGTTEQKFNTYLQGTEAHLNTLKSSGEGVFMKVFNSEDLRTGIDLLTGIVNGINSLVDAIGAIPTAFGTATAAISIFKKQWSAIQLTPSFDHGVMSVEKSGYLINFYNSIKSSITTLRTEYKRLNLEFQATFGAEPPLLNKVGMGFQALTKTTIAQTVATIGLKVATMALNAIIGAGIGLVISGIISAITKWINKTAELKRANEELIQTVNQNIQNNNDAISQLQSLGKEYETLTGKTKLTAKEHERLVEVQNSIADIAPQVVSSYDKEGNAAITLKNGIQDLIDVYKEKNRLEELSLLNQAPDFYKTNIKDIKSYTKQIEDLGNELNALQLKRDSVKQLSDNALPNDEGLSIYKTQLQSLDDQMISVNQEIEVLRSKLKDSESWYQPFARIFLQQNDTFNSLDASMQKYIMDLVNMQDKFGNQKWESIRKQIEDVILQLNKPKFSEGIKAIDTLKEKYKQGTISLQTFKDGLDKIIYDLNQLSGLDIETLTSLFGDTSSIEQTKESIFSLNELETELAKTLSDNKSTISSVNKLLSEHAKTGEWDRDAILDLAQTYPQLLDKMNDDKALSKELEKIKTDLADSAFDRLNKEIEATTQEGSGAF
jgi:TP901 family phage tail tape measure protein